MRIIDSSSAASQSATTSTNRTGQAQPVSPSSGGASKTAKTQTTDRVEISGFMGKVSEALRVDSANRAERVQQISAAVQSGTYRVDAQAVSKALVDHAVASSGNTE